MKNGATVFLLAMVIIGSITWVIFSESGSALGGFVSGLILGFSKGLIIGLNRGLATVIKHYTLRLFFCFYKKTPLEFIPFLDYCAKLILLKKGGGYIFIHRMLQEHFANAKANR